MFLDLDIASFTTNGLCERMDIEININVKKRIVEDAMAEEEQSKIGIALMMEKTLSLPTCLRTLQLVQCYLKQRRCGVNLISRMRLLLYDVITGEMESERSVRRGGKTCQLPLTYIVRMRKYKI